MRRLSSFSILPCLTLAARPRYAITCCASPSSESLLGGWWAAAPRYSVPELWCGWVLCGYSSPESGLEAIAMVCILLITESSTVRTTGHPSTHLTLAYFYAVELGGV